MSLSYWTSFLDWVLGQVVAPVVYSSTINILRACRLFVYVLLAILALPILLDIYALLFMLLPKDSFCSYCCYSKSLIVFLSKR